MRGGLALARDRSPVSRVHRTFERVFEHATASLALLGGLLLTIDDRWRLGGLLVTLAVAAAVIVFAFRRGSEPFAIYAYIYAVIALDIVIVEALDEDVFITLYLIVSTIAAIAGLFVLHNRFQAPVIPSVADERAMALARKYPPLEPRLSTPWRSNGPVVSAVFFVLTVIAVAATFGFFHLLELPKESSPRRWRSVSPRFSSAGIGSSGRVWSPRSGSAGSSR